MNYFYLILLKLLLILVLSASSIKALKAQNLEFNTDGLYNAELFDYLYRGHFENIKMDREDLEFLQIFDQYLRAYGRQCDDYLPADKVKIMDWKCAREDVTVTKNLLGVELSRSSVCVEWEQVWSRLYARPDLYRAKEELSRIFDANTLRIAAEMMTDQNALGTSVDMAHKAKALVFDMARIFDLNSCNSPGIRRFEENLKLFALNKPAIRMEGVSKYAAMKESGGPTGKQDLNRLIDDLVADQARTWMMNRYSHGSISDVNFLDEDLVGRPTAIKANYQYSGFSGKSKGWVKVTFDNGLPNGIYFFDFPNNRKTPSSSIVASYAQGNYAAGDAANEPAEANCDQPVFIADEMPEVIGGNDAIQGRVVYPEELKGSGISGRVYVKLVVGSEGQVLDAEIARGVDEVLDRHALEIARGLPFRGGKHQGRPVCVYYTLPIYFEE